MKKQGVGTFAGIVLIGLMIIDWIRCRLFISKVSGYVDGARIVLNAYNESEDEKKA